MEKKKIELPIDYLKENVDSVVESLISLGFREEVKRGLGKEIQYSGDIHNVAGVEPRGNYGLPSVSNPDNAPIADVRVSGQFCQMFWMICNIGLRLHDSAAVAYQYEKMSAAEKAEFDRELNVDCEMTRYLRQIRDWDSNVRIASELGDTIKRMLNEGVSNEELLNDPLIASIYTPVGHRTNGVYIYGIAFILAHEISHFALGHDLRTDGTIDDEIDADEHAFWSFYSDLEADKQSTAMNGVLCALAALLFVNPSLAKDGVHPQENYRLFERYDTITEGDQRRSYMQMLIMILTIWAVCCDVKDFPKPVEMGVNEDCLNAMRVYLANRALNAPQEEPKVFGK